MLLLFGILNLYRIYSGYRKQTGSEPQFYSAYFRVYENVSGEWNNDIIRYVVAEYEKAKAVVDAGGFSTEPNQPGTHTGYIFGDMNVFEQIKNEMDERYHYEQTMRKLTGKRSILRTERQYRTGGEKPENRGNLSGQKGHSIL